MKNLKNFFLVPLLLIYINCTNVAVNLNTANKIELNQTITELKETATDNQYEELEKYFLPTFKNKKIIEYIGKYDLSRVNIIISEPSFQKNGNAKNIMILNYGSESIYFNITWKYKDNEWKILNVVERK